MKRNKKYTPNECIAYKSLPNIQFSSNSNKILQLHTSKSLPSCLKFVQGQFQYDKRVSISNKMNIFENNKINPTIGELLGDDDLFHYHYHNQYSSSRSKRKRHHHHRSYSRSPYIHVHYGRRKQRRSNYSNTMQESPHLPPSSSSKFIQSIPDINQVYLYPTAYSYTPIPSYCYYCYSNMTSRCPCLISDCYGGLYQQEICETSTS